MFNRKCGFVLIVLLAGAVLLSGCGSADVPIVQAGAAPAGRSVTVVGQGKASGTPDIAHITIGIETSSANTKEAVVNNKQQMSALLERLQALGIAEQDIQTSNYNIYTEQLQAEMMVRPVDGGKGAGVIYHVSNQVNVTVRDINKLGDILDQAVEQGVNTVYGIYFEVSDPSGLEAQAREKAIADAQARAENLAKLSGVSVGEVLVISEVIGATGPVAMYDRAMASGLGGGTPIQAGQLEVVLNVQVTYAIR